MNESNAPAPGTTEDLLVCVDSGDNVLGFKGKFECHTGHGILHRAFSVFLFNARNEVLLQQRAPGKRLWPGFWSNACCSHPRKDERLETAVERRLVEELGVQTAVRYLFTFEYHARYLDQGSEHELCSVLAGRYEQLPVANPDEISGLQFVAPGELDALIAAHPERYSPWLKLEWAQLRAAHWHTIVAL